MHNALIVLISFLLTVVSAFGQTKMSVHWEELTAGDFRTAIEQSHGTCLLPFGIIEKHGPHLPLGTDLLNVRYATLHAAEQEFAVVFPEYYFGQIFEAQQGGPAAVAGQGAEPGRYGHGTSPCCRGPRDKGSPSPSAQAERRGEWDRDTVAR